MKNESDILKRYRQKLGPKHLGSYMRDPEMVTEEFYNYLDLCGKAKCSPTFEGMMAYMFKSKKSYQYYKSKEDLEEVFEFIELVLADATINGRLSDSMKSMILKNKCGYSEKIENINNNTHKMIVSEEERERLKLELKEKFDIEVLDK